MRGLRDLRVLPVQISCFTGDEEIQAQHVLGEPVSFFNNQQNQSDVNWMSYLLKPRPKRGWTETLSSMVTRGWKLAVPKPLHIRDWDFSWVSATMILAATFKSFSWTLMAQPFLWFWDLVSILPLNFFFPCKPPELVSVPINREAGQDTQNR